MQSTTITHVRNDLLKLFDDLKAGNIEAKDAVEINNTAGKIISSAKVQLAYHALRGETPNIPFLAADSLSVVENKPENVVKAINS